MRFEGLKIVLNFTWRPLREGFYHATVAKDVKVNKKYVAALADPAFAG